MSIWKQIFDSPEEQPMPPAFAGAELEDGTVINWEAGTVTGFLARIDAKGNRLRSDRFEIQLTDEQLDVLAKTIISECLTQGQPKEKPMQAGKVEVATASAAVAEAPV